IVAPFSRVRKKPGPPLREDRAGDRFYLRSGQALANRARARPPASPAGRAERMHMHMCMERTANVAFVIDRGSRKLETPERTVPPGGRSLAPCLTWRQAATSHHG